MHKDHSCTRDDPDIEYEPKHACLKLERLSDDHCPTTRPGYGDNDSSDYFDTDIVSEASGVFHVDMHQNEDFASRISESEKNGDTNISVVHEMPHTVKFKSFSVIERI